MTDALRAHTPQAVKDFAKTAIITTRRLNPRHHNLPQFLIIGTQRGGTTSLYSYLSQHPKILSSVTKEVQYFSVHYHKGSRWYEGNFPNAQAGYIAGEASPYYLLHPHAPSRARALVPDAKLIVLLRNPIERAISSYHHCIKRGHESLTMEAAFRAEAERLKGEEARLLADPSYYSFAHQHLTYLERGIYAPQLHRWLEHYPREQMLILKSEDLFADPARVFGDVLNFLGVEAWQPAQFKVLNATQKTKLDPELQAWLTDYYAPHNDQLCREFGICFD